MRDRIRSELYHFDRHLDPRSAQRLEMHVKHEQFVDQVYRILCDAGAPATCYVFTPDEEPYGAERPLAAALRELMWDGAGFLSCIAGQLALYVSEDGSNVFLLSR